MLQQKTHGPRPLRPLPDDKADGLIGLLLGWGAVRLLGTLNLEQLPRASEIRLDLVAVLFILFDVEIIFFYPWAVNFRALGLFGFIEMLVFVGILLVGYIYVWKKGAFEWD